VSGYMLAAREAGAAGASMFDRIMILPTSTAPRNAPPAAPVVSNMPGGMVRPIMPRPPDDQEAEDEPQDVGGSETGGAARPVVIQRPPLPTPFGGLPGGPPVPVAPDNNPPPAPPGVVTTPTNPFGLPPGASVRPGVIAPAPQPQPGQGQLRPNDQ
jgi:hypothetical protein